MRSPHAVILNVHQEQQKSKVDLRIQKLRCADQSSLDSKKACHKSTRLELLDELTAFASHIDPSSPTRVLILTGVAGCGKTAIAQSIAQQFDHLDWGHPRLGACFNFSVQSEDRRTIRLLFSTIASTLSTLDPKLAASIADALELQPTLASSASFTDQFCKLVEGPLCEFASSTPYPIAIVLDALDE
ncbi:hypothetical protein DL93DRAFT_2068729, partial [Clavulina sp. PMI_390]